VAAKLPLAGPLVSSVCSALAAPRHGRDPWRDDCDHPRQPRTPREREREGGRRVNSAAPGPVLESRPEGRTGQHPTRRALEAAGERQGGGEEDEPGLRNAGDGGARPDGGRRDPGLACHGGARACGGTPAARVAPALVRAPFLPAAHRASTTARACTLAAVRATCYAVWSPGRLAFFFYYIAQYIGDTHNEHMYTHLYKQTCKPYL
jgi:hypothetical protein